MIYRVLYIPGRWFGISSINNKQPPLELNHSIDDSSPAKVQEKHMVFKADLAGCRGITSKTLSVDHGESTRFGFRGSFTASPFGIRRAVAIRSQGGILCPKDERFEISGELFQSKSSENRTLFGGWVKCTIFGSYFTQTFDISFSISHHCQPSQCPRPLWRTSSDFCSYCSVVSLGWLIKISVIPEWQQSPGCKKNLPIKLMIIFWRYEEVVRIDHFPVNIPALVFIYKALKPTHLVPKKMAAAAFWPLISSMIFSWHPSHPPFDNSYRSAWRGHSIQYTNICQWLMFAPGGWTPIISVEILTPWADSRWLEKSSCTDNVMMSKKKKL